MIVTAISLPLTSGLRINEIEPNPAGEDKGNEWVELYSESEINLQGYTFVNNKGKMFNLSGTFLGYHVITFPALWLVNTNESVTLKNGNEVIDQTSLLKDDKNDGRAWSFCNEWKFIESSKGEENNCDGGNSNQTGNQQNTGSNQNTGNNNQNQAVENETIEAPLNEENVVPLADNKNTENGVRKKEKIVLGRTNVDNQEKKDFISSAGRVQLLIIYAFAGFCVLLIILLALRKV